MTPHPDFCTEAPKNWTPCRFQLFDILKSSPSVMVSIQTLPYKCTSLKFMSLSKYYLQRKFIQEIRRKTTVKLKIIRQELGQCAPENRFVKVICGNNIIVPTLHLKFAIVWRLKFYFFHNFGGCGLFTLYLNISKLNNFR